MNRFLGMAAYQTLVTRLQQVPAFPDRSGSARAEYLEPPAPGAPRWLAWPRLIWAQAEGTPVRGGPARASVIRGPRRGCRASPPTCDAGPPRPRPVRAPGEGAVRPDSPSSGAAGPEHR